MAESFLPLKTQKADMDNNPINNKIKKLPYEGKVELHLPAPVMPRLVSLLYNSLQTIPELKIALTAGNIRQRVIITVVLDKPIALADILSVKLPDIVVIPEAGEINSLEPDIFSASGIQKSKIRRIILMTKKSYNDQTSLPSALQDRQ